MPICVCMLSCVQLYETLLTVACQAPLSMEFSRQEYWNRLPFPTPGDLSNPRINLHLTSPELAGGFFFTTAPPGKPIVAARRVLTGTVGSGIDTGRKHTQSSKDTSRLPFSFSLLPLRSRRQLCFHIWLGYKYSENI